MFLHKPDTVQAATVGDPPLADPKQTTAPEVFKQINAEFANALNPNAPKAPVAADAAANAPTAEAAAVPAPAAAVAAAPLQLNEVPNSEDAPVSNGASAVGVSSAPAAATPAGNSMGVEIITHPAGETPAVAPSTPAAPADNYGLKGAGPANATPLPPTEKPAEAPATVNDIPAGAAPPAQTSNANGKNPKPEMDKSDESSSKHKPKKGLGKLNPF